MWHINKHHFMRFCLLVSFLFLNLIGSAAQAARTDDDFREYLRVQCEQSTEFVSKPENFLLCDNLFPGSFAESLKGGDSIIVPTGNNTDSKDPPRPRLQVGGVGSTVSAGAEDGGFGLLLTKLDGETERSATENENAFDSELEGHVWGVDYTFSEVFVLGAVVSSIEEEARIAGDMGNMKTESDSQTIYGTWVPVGNLSVDFYYGNSDSDIATLRDVRVEGDVTIEGLAFGAFKNSQEFHGASFNYDWYLGAWSLGAFAAMDSIETEIDGYDETGVRTNELQPGEIAGNPPLIGPGFPTGFELRFPDQNVESVTTSIGLRTSVGIQYGWGSLVPNLKVIAVKEHEDDARIIDVSLAAAPEGIDPFTVQTDAPDRDYMTGGFGIVAAFNGGSQIFLDYEQRSGHEFIETSSVTLGALITF
jgi:outer membrane lipase/esterase